MASVLRQEYHECYICGKTGDLDHHHLIGGSYRDKADELGLWIWLCREHHTEAHDDPFTNLMYKRLGQYAFEKTYAREKFIEIFGKSFVDKEIKDERSNNDWSID